MSQRIGFDREIRLDWLDATAGIFKETEDIEKVREYLHNYLAEYFPHYEARRKTITVLTRVWCRIPESDRSFRDEALVLLPALNQTDRIWLHWGLCLLAYPFFRDVVRTADRSLRYYGSFSKREIVQQMSVTWGERATLPRAVERVLSSLYDWGFIVRGTEKDKYEYATPVSTGNREVEMWLLKAVVCAHPKGSLPADKIHAIPEVFPFSFSVSVPDVLTSGDFEVSQLGNNQFVLRCPEKR